MTRSPFRIAALVLLVALFATLVYRAATQSIVHDEAFSWEEYLSGPSSMIFQHYDANNHFLATILFRISTTVFGDSELAMRLPTVLAGAWFFWTVFRLCELFFGDGWFCLLGCCALALNPILLDFLVAARGYGLAMAGLFWTLYEMLEWQEERSRGIAEFELRKRLWKASAGCFIAVAANLTFLMPVFVLATAFCVLLLRKSETGLAPASPPLATMRKKSKKAKPKAPRQQVNPYAPFLHFVVPVIVLAIAFLLAAPIDLARSQDFYAGTPEAIKSLRSLMGVSFAYGNDPGPMHRIEQIWAAVALLFLPVIVVTALIVVSITNSLMRTATGLVTLFSSIVVVGSASLLAGAHLLIGVPYPEDRTGIYFVPLAILSALGLSRILSQRTGPSRWMGSAIAVVLVSFALEFAAQWNVRSFWVWRYDADTKRIFEKLETEKKLAAPPAGQVRLGVSWQLEPALNYYREVRKAAWMAPVERDGFDGQRQFYVVLSEDQNQARLPKMRQIYRGPVSGTALALPQ